MKKTIALIAATFVIAGASPALMAADGPSPQTCIRLTSIDESPVIDDRTILVKMKNNQFKRIDLASPCSGLTIAGGFNHVTHSDDLCTTDTLYPRDHSGSVCGIKRIVDISPDEAQRLSTARR